MKVRFPHRMGKYTLQIKHTPDAVGFWRKAEQWDAQELPVMLLTSAHHTGKTHPYTKRFEHKKHFCSPLLR